MPSAREIRVRMNSIQQTRKITNAMYLIASTKMRNNQVYIFVFLPNFFCISPCYCFLIQGMED